MFKLQQAFVLFCLFFLAQSYACAGTVLRINPDKQFQTIEGFGASDCWTVNYVGQYFSDSEKNKAAQWLFSSKMDKKGQPLGIGLQIWRVNLGAGTLEQGDSSKIKDITRRAESFLDREGKYDWSKQAGQQWFIAKAKSHGCKSFVLFSNSPPLPFTRNGYGFSVGDGNANLKPECYESFANYLVDVAVYLSQKHKINIDYISPANEPQWPWNGDYQEGSPWQNTELKKMAVELDKALDKQHFKSTILITEAAKWDFIYRNDGRASDQIESFYNPQSNLYLGALKHVKPIVGAHSYWTDRSNDTLVSIRKDAYEKAMKYDLQLHQTEWSMLSVPPIDNFPPSYSEANYTDIALNMAKVMYADLAYANVSTWSYWTSMDVEMYGFKNRFNLIRLNTKGDSTSTIKSGGTVSAMKNLWMLGNYSLFVKPGYKRIEISDAANLNDLMGLSFISPTKKQIVTVLTNIAKAPNSVTLSLPRSFANRLKSVKAYLTNSSSDLKYSIVSTNSIIILPARSVTTIVYDFK